MPTLRFRRTSLDLKKSKSVLKNQCMLARSEFFSKSSEKFLQDLSAMLEVDLFLPGQDIVKAGEDGDRMYFLNWGAVEVILADKVVGVLGSGEVFGEMALFGNGKRTCTVRATDTCDCRSVNQHSFQRLLTSYPKERERFEKLVEDRMQETSKVKQDLKRERERDEKKEERKSVAPGSKLRAITLRSLSVIAKMGVKGLQPKAMSVDGPAGLANAEPSRRPRRTRPATDSEVWENSGARLSTDSTSGPAVAAVRSVDSQPSAAEDAASVRCLSLSRRSSTATGITGETGEGMEELEMQSDGEPVMSTSFALFAARTLIHPTTFCFRFWEWPARIPHPK